MSENRDNPHPTEQATAPRERFLSIAIPLYNKGEYIDKTLESIREHVSMDGCEIVVFDNGSEDDSYERVCEWQERLPIRIYRGEQTVSINESWTTALRFCGGRYVKLMLGDDLVLNDFRALAETAEERGLDYIVGRTVPGAGAENYYDQVNAFRSRIHPDLTVDQKVASLVEFGISMNPFGDPNSWVMRRGCLDVLPDFRRQLNGYLAFPDLEILGRVYLK